MPSTQPRLSGRALSAASAIFLLGAGLRLWGITSGAPYRMATDEWAVLTTSVRIMRSGDFNPHFFDYGGLIFYLHTAVAIVRFLTGANSGSWHRVTDMWEGDLLVYSRVATAIIGMATVLIVFRAGLRWNTPTALVAMAVMAVLPQHVRESHYVLTDIPLTFFVALAWLLTLRATEGSKPALFALAGLAVGAATAIKYNGLLAAIIPISAVLFAGQPGERLRGFGATLVGMAAGFVVAAPYSVLDLPGFLNGFAALMQHYNAPRPVGDAIVIYLKYMRNWFTWPEVLWLEVGWIALSIAGVGVLMLLRDIVRPGRRAVALATVVFPLAYLWFISNQGALQYGRYALPLTPMLSVAVASGLVAAVTKFGAVPRLRRVAPALAALVLVPPLAASASWDAMQSKVGTADQAAAWISRNVSPDQLVVVEAEAFHLPPRFKVHNVPRLVDRTIDQYREDGVVYLVASSLEEDRYVRDPTGRQNELTAYRAMRRATEIVQIFSPSEAHPGSTLTVLRIPPR